MTSVPSGHVLSKTAGVRVAPLVALKLNSSTASAAFAGGAGRAGIDGVTARFEFAGRLCLPAAFDFGLSLCPVRRIRSGDRLSAASTARLFALRRRQQRQPAGRICSFRPCARRHTVDRVEKKECVEALSEVFKTAAVVVVAHYSSLNVAQMQDLRRRMRAAGATVRVAKNRLVKIAVQGTKAESIAPLMRGPTLIAYSDDPVAAPKVAVAFAKDHEKLVILGGAMGATALTVDGVRALATLPSLDELRAKLVGLIQAPAAKLVRLTTAPAAKLARVVSAYAEKGAA